MFRLRRSRRRAADSVPGLGEGGAITDAEIRAVLSQSAGGAFGRLHVVMAAALASQADDARRSVVAYQQTGDPADLDRAATALSEIVDNPLRNMLDSAGLAVLLYEAALLVGRRARDPGDLRRRVDLLQAAEEIAEDGSDVHTRALVNVGVAMEAWYEVTGEEGDLNAALAWYERAQSEPLTPGDVALVAFNLGNSLHERAIRFDAAALDDAVAAYERAVTLTDESDPYLPGRFSGLGTGLRERFRRTGNREDIERSIEAQTKALAGAIHAGDDGLEARSRMNLGIALRDRHQRFGDESDLDRAIDQQQLALEQTPEGSPGRLLRLHSLGTAMYGRFLRSGLVHDLDRAIDCLDEARENIARTSPEYPRLLTSLGVALRSRAHRFPARADEDLDLAIAYLREGLTLEPDSSPYRVDIETNLGSAQFARYLRRSGSTDKRESIEHLRAAAARMDPGSPERGPLFGDLGRFCLWDYLGGSGDAAMLQAAVSYFVQAAASTPPSHTYRPQACFDLANALRARHRLDGEAAVLSEGLRYFREAAERGMITAPSTAIRATYQWGRWTADLDRWEESADALSLGQENLLRLVELQASRADKESWLRVGEQVAAEAAYVHGKLGHYESAAVAAESGRGLLLAEMLELTRTDLSRLAGHPGGEDLVTRFDAAVRRWSALPGVAGDRVAERGARTIRELAPATDRPPA